MPTAAQKRAGNYRKGHVRAHGLDVTIENMRGSFRSGTDKDGNMWRCRIPHHYGYIRRTEGADGDHVDCYIGPHLKSPKIFIIDQADADSGDFDEHKVFMGFASRQQVAKAYASAFSDGRASDRMGAITEMTPHDFREWLKDGDTKKPVHRAMGGRVPGFDSGGAANGNDWVTPNSSGTADDWMKSNVGTASSETPVTFGGIAKQAALGVGRGLLDLGGTLAEGLTFKSTRDLLAAERAANAQTDEEAQRAAFKNSLSHSMGDTYGLRARTALGMEGQNAPHNVGERIASGMGSGASGAVLGGPSGLIRNAVIGAIGGGTGAAAGEIVPDPYKPIAELAGNVLGVGAAGAIAAGAAATPQIASRMTQPFTREGQMTLAGRYLESRASDPEALRQSLAAPVVDIVPGSKPTTFQQTGDMGIGALERETATRNPEAFNLRRADQNAARLDAIGEIQQGGNPEAVASAVQGHLRQVDAITQRYVEQATREAQERAATLGGTQAQDVYGSNMRNALRNAEEEARTYERALWDNVDPHNDLTMNMLPVQRAYQSVYGDMSDAARATLKPVEHSVGNVIGQYQPVERFRELTDLRSLVSSAMREEMVQNGRTPAYGRLARLRGGIEDSINNAVADRAQADAANVAAGVIAPENSLAASIQRQIAEWQAARGRGAVGAVEGIGTGGPGSLRATPRNSGATGDGSDAFTGNQGIPSPIANFDQAAAQRLRDASTATRERAQTFGRAPLKGVLQREGQTGPYRMREAAVPEKIFHPGDTGFEDVRTFRNAVGDDVAMPLLRDYAASSLRSSALTPEGIVDPTRFARWRNQHAEALRAFPELDRQFANAADASEAVGRVAARRRDELAQAQEGALGKLINVSDRQDVVKTIGSLFGTQGSVREIQRLAAQVGRNPEARQGLRQAVVDHMMQKFVSNAEAATSGRPIIKADQLQNFIKNNDRALAVIFSPTEMQSMRNIAADLQRANRSIVAVKLPGQSNTAQDLAGMKYGQSRLASMFIDAAAKGGNMLAAFVPGANVATAAGSHVANAVRSSGFSRVDELVREAMLNPAFAKVLLDKAAANPSMRQSADRMFARRLVALSAASMARHNQDDRKFVVPKESRTP